MALENHGSTLNLVVHGRIKPMKRWQFWVGILISIVFLYIALSKLRLDQFWDAIKSAHYLWLVPGIAVYFVGVWVRAWRWHYLLRPVKKVSTQKMFPIVTIGYMGNNIYPARAGEVLRAVVLKRHEGVPISASLATIIVERIFDGVTMLLFIGVILLLHLVPPSGDLEGIFRVAGLIFVGLLASFFLVALSPGIVNRTLDFILSAMPPALAERAEVPLRRFLAGLRVLQSPRAVGATLGLSIVAWLCEAAMYYILAMGFPGITSLPDGTSLPYYAMVLNMAVANVFTMVPAAPGYIGTFDAASVFTLGLYGVEKAVALSYTVILHLVLLVPITLWGAYYWWHFHLSLREIQAPAAAAEGVEP